MDEKISKKTQKTLGKIIKKPPLTEKLLQKPPFRFLHDIMMAVINSTGFMEGLFEKTETNSENVKDKESKILFLQKAIDLVSLVNGKPLAVRPSKVVSGLEPERTNEFLQALADAINKKVDNRDYVKRVLKNDAPAEKERSKKSKKKDRDDDDKENRSRDKSERRRGKDEEKSKKHKDNDNYKQEDDEKHESKKKHKKHRSKEQSHSDADEQGEVKVADRERSKKSKKKGRDNDDNDRKGRDKSERRRETDGERSRKHQDSNRDEEAEEKDRARKKHKKHRSKEENQSEDEQEKHIQNDKKLTNNSKVRPSTAKGTRKNRSANKVEENEKPKGPETPARLARPPSARPAPHVMRNQSANDKLSRGAVPNVITDHDLSSDEDGFITKEEEYTQEAQPALEHNNEEEDGEHGGLVKKMLDSKKEASKNRKTEIERSHMNDASRRKERQMAQQEIDKLRSSIQELTRSVNPLGKMMDFVQEDLDSMQKELYMWNEEHEKNLAELSREEKITVNKLDSLRLTRSDLENAIADQQSLIAAAKSNVIRNNDKISKMIGSIAKS